MMAENYIGVKALGGAGRRGPLIAEFVVTRNSEVRGRSSEIGAASGRWDITDYGLEAGFDVSEVYLTAPNRPPDGCRAIEVVGGDDYQSAIMPYFGEIHNLQGVGGSVIAVDATERISVRMHLAEHPREIRMAGAETALSVGAKVSLYAAI